MPRPVDVTTPSDREIRVTRTFDAPRSLVFECHTDPDLVRRWLLGPPGWSMPVCEIDFRVGGRFRYEWRSDTDGSGFGIGGEFREIDAPARVVHVERMDGMPGESLVTLELTEHDGRTTLAITMRFDSREARDGAAASGMTTGMAASYDRLESVMGERQVA